ncbi:hypothetical protein Q0F98_39285 [Paenibacillus amylolyticus]|nr:hypothetical protein Q0F98_39285 [Paenibacillus amylolyticus]
MQSFLHRLNEAGAIDEAEQLFRAIRLKFVNELERGSVPNITIITYYAALTIKSEMTSQNPVYEFSNHIQRLIVLLKQSESVDEDSRLIEDIVAFNRAYLLWKRGMYISIQHYEQETAFGHGISTLLCKMLIHLEGFQAWGDSSVENSQYIEFIQDIKYVIKQYGIDEDDRYLILTALTDVDFEVDIVAQLIDEQMDLKETKFSIRESNGVDFDYESITNYLDAWRYKGFIDEGDNYPSILNYGTSNWELYFEELVSLVGYVLGKAWKGKSAKQDDSINNVATVVEQYLLPKLIVSLKERVKWDRSYALPEEFYPFVFNEIASFYIKYCVDKLPQFVEVIESHSLDQLGLYTEGFRQAMYSIIKEMIKSKKYVKSTFRLLKMLEDHIILGVQNRWDRSKDLLQIAEIYARIGSEPRSKAAFQHMLDTSMGPTWYKEDQLTLLETGITYLQSSGEMSNHLKEIAGHYDFASGEITFQRYVRQVKEAFIGNLCTMGRVTQAVEYFKNSVLPLPEKVLQLTEEDQIDTPETGKGYIFGAGGLDEQSCILEILENAPNVKGLLKWAFCELYMIGDDRYFDRYTKIMADLLNERETIGSDELPVLYRRLLRIMISDMSPDNRKRLLSYLKRDLSDSNYNHLISLLQKAGMRLEADEGDSDWTRRATQDIDISDKAYADDENDGLYLPGTFGRRSSLTELDKQMLLAKDQLDIENFDLAKQHFIEGLKKVQFGGWDIWTSRSGAEVVEAFEMLSGLSSTEEFVKSLCSLILDEIHASDWVIVNKLITSIGEKLDSSDASSVFHSVLEHIRFMLRTPDAYIEKYEWFEQESQDVSNNVLLTDLFIWLFNHPKSTIEYRAPEIMKGLVRTDPSFFVPMLINKSLSNDTSLSPEICAGILHSLAIEDASLVWEYLQIKENQERIVELDHFMVKHTFMEIVKLAGKNTTNANDFYTIFSESFLNEIPKRLFDFNKGVETPYWLSHFHEILEPLEQIGVLVKNDYQELTQYVSEMCLPLSVEDFMRADIYVTRSYRSNQEFERLEMVVRKGINKLLSKKVGKEQLTRVANHLRIYNPHFPNEGVRLTSKPSLISSVNDLISGKGDHAENCTHEGAYDYLHYLETVFCLEEGRFKLIEIIGFLVGQDAFQSPFNLDDVYQSFFSNEQPNFQNTPTTDSHIYGPAVYKVEPKTKLSGGSMTPAFLHPYLVEVLGEIREQDVIRESWLEGRDWDVDRIGMPLREGCRLLVSKEAVKQLSLTPWRLVWLVKYDFNRSFIIDRDFKMIYSFD